MHCYSLLSFFPFCRTRTDGFIFLFYQPNYLKSLFPFPEIGGEIYLSKTEFSFLPNLNRRIYFFLSAELFKILFPFPETGGEIYLSKTKFSFLPNSNRRIYFPSLSSELFKIPFSIPQNRR